jgi:hypothetical protein
MKTSKVRPAHLLLVNDNRNRPHENEWEAQPKLELLVASPPRFLGRSTESRLKRHDTQGESENSGRLKRGMKGEPSQFRNVCMDKDGIPGVANRNLSNQSQSGYMDLDM